MLCAEAARPCESPDGICHGIESGRGSEVRSLATDFLVKADLVNHRVVACAIVDQTVPGTDEWPPVDSGECIAGCGEGEVADEFATNDEEVRARASSGYAAAREEDVRNGLYRLRRAWATERTLASLVAKGGAGELTVDAILSSAELGGPLFEADEAAPAEEEAP